MATPEESEANDLDLDLSPDKMEKLLQYQDLTGTDDTQECRRLLEAHQWNIESAVQDRFSDDDNGPGPAQPDSTTADSEDRLRLEGSGGGREVRQRRVAARSGENGEPDGGGNDEQQRVGDSSTTTSSSSSTSQQHSTQRHNQYSPLSGGGSRHPVVSRLGPEAVSSLHRPVGVAGRRQQPVGWLQWGYMWLTLPFRFMYTTLVDLITFVYSLLRPDARRMVTDPVGDVVRFISQYEAKYGPRHPTFYRGSYTQVLSAAKRDLRFLVIYLHSDDHQDVEPFCNETLSNKLLIDFINAHCLFWACSIKLPEGYRVSQAIRELTYPFLALAMLRENRMTIIARFHGPVTSNHLVDRLSNIMAINESALIQARSERHDRSMTESIRQQQDVDYHRSLEEDQEKERRKQEEARRARDVEEGERKKEEEQIRKIQEVSRTKAELSDQIPPEPPLDSPCDAIKVLLKLPDGTRLERRFLREHSIKYLYYYVFCHEAAPDDFQIVTNFPRRELPCRPTPERPEPPTFLQVGLGRAEVLFVQDNDA